MPGFVGRVYSFVDVFIAFVSAAGGIIQFGGEGVGDVSITPATEKTAIEMSNDGGAFMSKVAGQNATMTISCPQASKVDSDLIAFFDALELLPTSMWAGTTATVRSASEGHTHILNGVAFQIKRARTYGKQAGMVSWTFIVGDEVELPI